MSSSFEQAFREHTADLPASGGGIHYTQSADRLRRLLKEGPLKLTDIHEAPSKFFTAHTVLSEYATRIGPGFGIRFTVQVNLFSGTIIALGNAEQVASLSKIQAEGRLGCFCLTERLAGVNSGLVVQTTAVWDEQKQMFKINCPDEGSKKNWISQGLTADLAVVVATLIVKGKSVGPHAFIMDLRKSPGGDLVDGVTTEDMGDKTIGNDLDNARIAFKDVWIPKSALLDRYSGIENNEWVQRQKGVSNMDMIGQRLYTGRTVIADSALVFARTLYRSAKAYSDSKRCWHPKEQPSLSDMPQLSTLYAEADAELSRVEALRGAVQMELGSCLQSGAMPSNELVEKVAVLKVKAIETSISLCFRLKQELGSYALISGTGFEKMDYLQCCKFAEGDSRILLQKLARDRLSAFGKSQPGTEEEVKACSQLGMKLKTGGSTAWNDNFRLVYSLSDMICERIVNTASPSSKM
jgi:alkylation response protein AidB-like acyl-CoA dehydrogenase